MCFHIVTTCKHLVADRTRMALGTMNIRMMPTIWDSFVTRDTAIECWKSSGKLDEKSRIINIVIATWRWTSIISWTVDVRGFIWDIITKASAIWRLQKITTTAAADRINVVTTWRPQRRQKHIPFTCNNTGISNGVTGMESPHHTSFSAYNQSRILLFFSISLLIFDFV